VKKIAIVVALAAVLLIPATAGAKTKVRFAHYAGTASPAGVVSFNMATIKQRHKKARRLIGNFTFDGIPVTCADGPHVTQGHLTFAVKLLGGHFNMLASNSVTGAILAIHGTVAGPASGTIQVDGNVPIDASSNLGSDCHSGALNWTASRT